MSEASRQSILVTGANKGIGKEICRQLATKPNTDVILTSRNSERGDQAVSEIAPSVHQSSSISFVLLDVDDEKSIADATKQLQGKGPLDAVILNAGIAMRELTEEVVKKTFRTNYFGTMSCLRAFAPLVRDGGRVVVMSSRCAVWGLQHLSEERQKKFLAEDLTIDGLTALLAEYQTSVARGNSKDEGWPDGAYFMSKVGNSMMTRILAPEYPKLLVNCCTPGFVKTDLTGGRGNLTVEQGAETPVFVATEDLGGVTGKFFGDKKIEAWI